MKGEWGQGVCFEAFKLVLLLGIADFAVPPMVARTHLESFDSVVLPVLLSSCLNVAEAFHKTRRGGRSTGWSHEVKVRQ